MSKILTNTPRAGETAEQTAARRRRRPVTGYVQTNGQMTPEQFGALQRALVGGDSSAVVVIPASNFTDVYGAPNRLFGSYINEEGEAC